MEALYESYKKQLRAALDKEINNGSSDDRRMSFPKQGSDSHLQYKDIADSIITLADQDFRTLIPEVDVVFAEAAEKVMNSANDEKTRFEKLLRLSQMRHELDKRQREVNKINWTA